MSTLHQDLCVLAARWLRKPASKGGPGCLVAMSECQAAGNGEIPDAIGYRCTGWDQYTVLVEVKTTRADFLADFQKPHRIDSAQGMGMYRYYFAPAGVIDLAELPTGWGLVEVSGRSTRVSAGHILAPRLAGLGGLRDVAPWRHISNQARELALVVKMLARIGDVDEYQRNLKMARNGFARVATSSERYRLRADSAEKDAARLRERLREAGLEDAEGIPRVEALRKQIRARLRSPGPTANEPRVGMVEELHDIRGADETTRLR
jgi:hypothetical protein